MTQIKRGLLYQETRVNPCLPCLTNYKFTFNTFPLKPSMRVVTWRVGERAMSSFLPVRMSVALRDSFSGISRKSKTLEP